MEKFLPGLAIEHEPLTQGTTVQTISLPRQAQYPFWKSILVLSFSYIGFDKVIPLKFAALSQPSG